MNPYASYGASTSSAESGSEGSQGTENAEARNGRDPENHVANRLANLRRQIATAVLAGDDVEAARLMSDLAKMSGPKLRLVK